MYWSILIIYMNFVVLIIILISYLISTNSLNIARISAACVQKPRYGVLARAEISNLTYSCSNWSVQHPVNLEALFLLIIPHWKAAERLELPCMRNLFLWLKPFLLIYKNVKQCGYMYWESSFFYLVSIWFLPLHPK